MAELIEEKDELSVIVDKYYDTVLRLAMLHTKNREDAQDIAQEVFMKLVRYKRDFNDGEHTKAWLLRITVNLCHNLKTSVSQKTVSIEENLHAVEDFSERTDEQLRVYAAVASLKDEYKEIIHLYYYENYSLEEIAKIMRTSLASVKMRLKRGRQRLAEILGEEEDYV